MKTKVEENKREVMVQGGKGGGRMEGEQMTITPIWGKTLPEGVIKYYLLSGPIIALSSSYVTPI